MLSGPNSIFVAWRSLEVHSTLTGNRHVGATTKDSRPGCWTQPSPVDNVHVSCVSKLKRETVPDPVHPAYLLYNGLAGGATRQGLGPRI